MASFDVGNQNMPKFYCNNSRIDPQTNIIASHKHLLYTSIYSYIDLYTYYIIYGKIKHVNFSHLFRELDGLRQCRWVLLISFESFE